MFLKPLLVFLVTEMLFNYPTIIVDNFFIDPLAVRDLALTLDYTAHPHGAYSGKRSELINYRYPQLYQNIISKILNCYSIEVIECEVEMAFAYVTDSAGQVGWIHHDWGIDNRIDISSIIYLGNTSNNNLNNGTSLYRLRNPDFDTSLYQKMRLDFLNQTNNEAIKQEHNNSFMETTRIGEGFNKMVAYDARQFHAATGYYGKQKEDSRLTLNTFIKNIKTKSGMSPLEYANKISKI